jgi:aminoglycoside N3'-acetyltransferase
MNHHEINGNDRPKKYVTREDIKAGLRKLGLKKGDSVGVRAR